ncbi:MAG: hypothetical protein ACKN9T_18375 [Candidatus Methylumidiphilus sp.]
MKFKDGVLRESGRLEQECVGDETETTLTCLARISIHRRQHYSKSPANTSKNCLGGVMPVS